MVNATPIPGPSPNQEQDSQDSSALENRQSQPQSAGNHACSGLQDNALPLVATNNLAPSGKRSFHLTISPSSEFPFNNCAAVHPSDFPKDFVHVLVNGYPLTVCHDKDGQLNPGNIGLSLVQRRWIGISEPCGAVTVEDLPDSAHSGAPIFIHAMELEIDFLQKGYVNAKEYLSMDIASAFIDRFRGIVVTVGRTILFKFQGEALKGKIKSLTLRGASRVQVPASNDTHTSGIIFAGTDVIFTAAADATIKIEPYVRFPVSASTFAAGVQTVVINGGIFAALPATCPCATAGRCLAAGSKKGEVNFEIPSRVNATTSSDGTTKNKKLRNRHHERHNKTRKGKQRWRSDYNLEDYES